ncbi:CDK-activating kinase assembly factor mat1 [Plenodomus biglobosus]|nr:CDK-activating kinase assembly factor mat1 [Plenodomus biglobosus]
MSATEAFARAVVRDPTSAEVGRFLSTRSGAQMVALMRSIREPAAQAALTAALLAAPPAPIKVPEKAKKALNAFVGFRCYYISIPVFKSFPMKLLSQPIGMIWEADPNKSLWSLMAKAWSTIRDQIGKDNAPLDQFFGIVCPFLNMPTQETYLELHGWTLTVNKEGVPSLSRDESFEPAPVRSEATETPLSVEDIITYAKNKGYAADYVTDPNAASATFLSVHESRVRARNKRRLQRKNFPIIHAMHTAQTNGHYEDARLSGYELDLTNSQFYNNLSAAVIDAMLIDDDDETVLPKESVLAPVTATPVESPYADWAFVPGANANAILPSFGSN